MHVFYYGNETLDKNSLGWKNNGFQCKEEKNKREGQEAQPNVIDKTHIFKPSSPALLLSISVFLLFIFSCLKFFTLFSSLCFFIEHNLKWLVITHKKLCCSPINCCSTYTQVFLLKHSLHSPPRRSPNKYSPRKTKQKFKHSWRSEEIVRSSLLQWTSQFCPLCPMIFIFLL